MYKLSNLAAEDSAAIYEYFLINFGASQADAYLDSPSKPNSKLLKAVQHYKDTVNVDHAFKGIMANATAKCSPV